MRITIVAGARPNFMKIAPIIQAIERYPPSAKVEVQGKVKVQTGAYGAAL